MEWILLIRFNVDKLFECKTLVYCGVKFIFMNVVEYMLNTPDP